MLRHCAPHYPLEALRVDKGSKPHFDSTPERRNENIIFLISLNGNLTSNLPRYSHAHSYKLQVAYSLLYKTSWTYPNMIFYDFILPFSINGIYNTTKNIF